jgi:hypothetical protein
MREVILTLVTLLFSISSHAENKNSYSASPEHSFGEKNPFLGQWCKTSENEHSTDKLFFDSDNTIISFNGTEAIVTWKYTFNPETEMLIGDIQSISQDKATVEHFQKDDGISVLFGIAPNGLLVWNGPVLDRDFFSIDRKNIDQYLIVDVRVYEMTFERCEHLGF